MTPKTCLRCDWQGETKEQACPNCGEQPLYVIGAPPSGEAGVPVRSQPKEQSYEASSRASVAPVRRPALPPVETPPSPTDAVEPSGRSARSAVAFVVAALVLTVTLGTWLRAHEERAAPAAPTDGSPTPVVLPSATPGVDPFKPPPTRRHVDTVDGVPFSFRDPAQGWERFGSISINKSETGPQGAEAIIYWSSFPDGDYADPYGQYAHPCTRLLSPPVAPSAADLAAAVSRARGTQLVSGPSDVTVGGYPAKHVALTVSENVGCKPGYFFKWRDVNGGALWTRTGAGATMRVWIVDVDGTRLFIAAATTPQASPGLDREIEEIIGSIRFSESDPHTSAAVVAEYGFHNSLASSVGGGPRLRNVGQGASSFIDEVVFREKQTVLRFPEGNGLSLSPASAVIDGDRYSIELLFRLDDVDGYRKIIDLKDASDDSGLYIFDGRLIFFDVETPAPRTIKLDTYTQVLLTRKASGKVTAYVNGVRRFSFDDAGGLAVIDASDTLRFFIDDATPGREHSGGAVSRIRLYDGPLTASEVASLACEQIPEVACG